jgi:hypothetical protein
MKKYWKLLVGCILMVGSLGLLAVPYYNCVFWGGLSGVVFILWFLIDRRRSIRGK